MPRNIVIRNPHREVVVLEPVLLLGSRSSTIQILENFIVVAKARPVIKDILMHAFAYFVNMSGQCSLRDGLNTGRRNSISRTNPRRRA